MINLIKSNKDGLKLLCVLMLICCAGSLVESLATVIDGWVM